MKTLICSDIHDHVDTLARALEAATVAGCSSVICCGDLCAPFIIREFRTRFQGPVHVVFGNNDADRITMERLRQSNDPAQQGSVHLHGDFLFKPEHSQLPGLPDAVSLAVFHYPEPARAVFDSGKYQLVCCGHTHQLAMEQSEQHVLINPGSLMGYVPGQPAQRVKPTAVLFHFDQKQADVIELG